MVKSRLIEFGRNTQFFIEHQSIRCYTFNKNIMLTYFRAAAIVQLEELFTIRQTGMGRDFMGKLKEALHKKRETTENHIRQLQKDGKQGVRYTSMMPDIPFLILGLLSDAGWIMQLIAGILYFCRNGLRHASDYASLVALAAVVIGVTYLVYLNKIHEKEIATRLQKNLGFGLTVYAGLAGAAAGVLQIVTYAGASPELIWASAGGFMNFIFGLPIYFSFKKGIVYGVQ